MSIVRKNIVANMIGSAWSALLSIAFVPLYIHFMGVASYGLVGFYVTLQVLFSVLDMGLTATLSRELARLSATSESSAQDMRNVVRTLESVYWGLAVLIILSVALASNWIATGWLKSQQLDPGTVRLSVLLMGVVIAFRMPYGFYTGGFIGLQRQVLLNGMKIAVETFRNGGGVVVLWLFSPTITAFFIWHAVAAAMAAGLFGIFLWRILPESSESPRFTPAMFRQLWRYGFGMSGIAILSLLQTELDKLILSKMLPLEELGYYMLASTLAMGLNLIVAPIFSAMQPRLTQLVAAQDHAGVRQLYHKGCQLMTVLVMPVAFGLCFYAEPVLRLWTQNGGVALHSAPLLELLVVGSALNAMMNVPYALQLAHGWTRLVLMANGIAVFVLVPALVWMIERYGAIGAAIIWVVLNVGKILLLSPIVHARFMKGEFARWLLADFGSPTLAALTVVAFLWFVMPLGMGMAGQLAWICMTLLGSFLSVFFLTPVTRNFFRTSFVKLRDV